MTALNFIDFYRDSGKTLVSLSRVFPRKIELYVVDIAGDQPVDEFGLPNKRHLACMGAFAWLAEEGYIRFNSVIQGDGVDQAILTEKALNRLSQIYSTDDEPVQTLLAQIEQALDSGASEPLTRIMRSFFSLSE